MPKSNTPHLDAYLDSVQDARTKWDSLSKVGRVNALNGVVESPSLRDEIAEDDWMDLDDPIQSRLMRKWGMRDPDKYK